MKIPKVWPSHESEAKGSHANFHAVKGCAFDNYWTASHRRIHLHGARPSFCSESAEEAKTASSKLRQTYLVVQVVVYDAAERIYMPVGLQDPGVARNSFCMVDAGTIGAGAIVSGGTEPPLLSPRKAPARSAGYSSNEAKHDHPLWRLAAACLPRSVTTS
jgi:hypothetical protein